MLNKEGDIVQRYFAIDKINNKMVLEQSDIHHIKNVMRMNDGDLIEVVFEEQLYLCCIANVKFDVQISVKKELKIDTKKIDIVLIIPVLKEQKMDYILQKSTELGVTKIVPVLTERTIVKLDEKQYLKKKERWLKICKEAAEQSKRTTVPIIENMFELKALKKMPGVSILCSTVTKNNIKKYFQTTTICDRINIVIGPEGGISIKEEKYLNEIGFESISLGDRILRVETVPLFVLSILNYINME